MLTAWIKIPQIRKTQRILESSIYICIADLCLTTELLWFFVVVVFPLVIVSRILTSVHRAQRFNKCPDLGPVFK